MITKNNIDRLIEFGGLLVYEVSWFDTIRWESKVECRSFNLDFALSRFNSLKQEGFEAQMVSYFVHFNYGV